MRTTKRRTAVLLGLLVMLPSAVRAQGTYVNPVDFTEEALFAVGEIGVGARALGMGGAYSAIADDITALYYNPAGLAQIRRIELAFGLQHQRDRTTHGFFGPEASALTSRTGLDHLGMAYPFPTYRGSLVVGLGVFRARSADLDTDRRDRYTIPNVVDVDDIFLREQRGGVWRVVGGLGVDLQPSLSFGAGLSYWRGKLKDDEFTDILETDLVHPDSSLDYQVRDVAESDVDGFGFDLGLLGYLGRDGRLSLVVHSPTWMRIQGDAQRVTLDRTTNRTDVKPFFIDDRPRLPWSVALGGSYGLPAVLLSAEMRYTAWDELDLGPPDPLLADPSTRLPTQPSDYSARLGGRAGVEFLIPGLPVRLRGGYAYDPVVYDRILGNKAEITHQRHMVTMGAGLLVAEAFSLDAAVTLASFERIDTTTPHDPGAVFEKHTERRGFLAGTYRF